MNKVVTLVRSTIIFLVVFLCFLRKSSAIEAISSRNGSEVSSVNVDQPSATYEEISARDTRKITAPEKFRKEFAVESDSKVLKSENLVKDTKRNFDRINELFSPLMTFPFFPFHAVDLKRNAFHVNSSEKANRLDKETESSVGRFTRKSKPFLFIDFALNFQEIPLGLTNQTSARKSSSKDSLLTIHPRKAYNKRGGNALNSVQRNEDVPGVLAEEDWSFFDELPLLLRDMDNFSPKSKLRFFDSPFRSKQADKEFQDKRDKAKVVPKSDANMFFGFFDQAMSKMKRDFEKSVPLWDIMVAGKKTSRSEPKGSLSDKIMPSQDPESKLNDSNGTNILELIPDNTIISKGPIVTGKILKIGEIHVHNQYPKRKKKRRNSSAPEKTEKQGPGINPIRLRNAEEPMKTDSLNFGFMPTGLKDVLHEIREENGQGRLLEKRKESGKMVRGTQDARILDLMNQWDRREMEEHAEGKTTETERFETYNKETAAEKHFDASGALVLKDSGFEHIGQIPEKKDASKSNAGFEVLKPQPSSSRRKRQGNDGGGIWENVTASKDDVRRNITHVLGQFFSMIKKLSESKNLYQDKENQKIDDVIWPELRQFEASRPYAQFASNNIREGRQVEKEERDSPAPVADLNLLFLTVTLPTTLAFTLLLAICFFNLRPTSWLCQKVFQPRNLYVVEEDVEKSKPFVVHQKVEERTKKRKALYMKDEDKEHEAEEKSELTTKAGKEIENK